MSAFVDPGDGWTPLTERLPRPNHNVAILISDPVAAIHNYPTCAYLDVVFRGTKNERKEWWAGVPGNYHKLPGDGWIVTHWAELPGTSRGGEFPR